VNYVAITFTETRGSVEQLTDCGRGTLLTFITVATKYYTHFVTGTGKARAAAGNEWSGVVELRQPLTQGRANRELRSLLAQSFDLDSDQIRILHWARLH
jgi:hypothetical protein